MGDGIRSRRRERPAGDLHARPDDDAFPDRVPDCDVVVARAFSFEVAHRREAMFQRDADSPDRAHNPVRWIFLKQLMFEVRDRQRALNEDVRMRVDQAREHNAVAEIDHMCIRGRRSADRLDAVALDEQHLVQLVTSRRDIQEPRGADCDRSAGVGGG